MKQSDFLLLYIREDGVFARFHKGEDAEDREVREAVTEESIRLVLKKLFLLLFPQKSLVQRSVTAVYVLSKRVEVLGTGISDFLRRLSFVDSVTALRRDEILFRSARLLSERSNAKKQVLYFDSRETRLFTETGEWSIPVKSSGGNGFADWLIGFAENERDSFSYFMHQTDRLTALFRAYRCYRRPFESDGEAQKRILPTVKRGSVLSASPKKMEESIVKAETEQEGKTIDSAHSSAVKETDPADAEQIRYFALSDSDREKVDKKFPALYRTVRDKRGNYLHISIGAAAEAFKQLFAGIENAPLTDLTVVGQHADFPLLDDFLRALVQRPRLTYASESKLLLDGLTATVLERIASSALTVRDIDGDPIVLWNESPPEHPHEKRVSFYATLRDTVSAEEWRRRIPLLPYSLKMTVTVRDESGVYRREQRETVGDLRDSCYIRRKDGSYRLDLPESHEKRSPYRTVLVGIGATPIGLVCHLLEEKEEDPLADAIQ